MRGEWEKQRRVDCRSFYTILKASPLRLVFFLLKTICCVPCSDAKSSVCLSKGVIIPTPKAHRKPPISMGHTPN